MITKFENIQKRKQTAKLSKTIMVDSSRQQPIDHSLLDLEGLNMYVSALTFRNTHNQNKGV